MLYASGVGVQLPWKPVAVAAMRCCRPARIIVRCVHATNQRAATAGLLAAIAARERSSRRGNRSASGDAACLRVHASAIVPCAAVR